MATIILNYKRPQNIAPIAGIILSAFPRSPVFVLDQADHDSCAVWNSVPDEVWYRRAANEGPVARLRLALELAFDFYLAVDDDLFVTVEQVRRLATELQGAPGRVHGLWGQRLLANGRRLRLQHAIASREAEVTVLNQAYAFSIEHAAKALGLGQQAMVTPEDMKICDDILLSSASAQPPMCHDVGKLTVCPSYNREGIAVGTQPHFEERRLRVMIKLLELGRLHAFPLDAQ